MDGETLDVEQLRSLSRLPSREVLYGQLVGVVASPVSGLVRSLAALVGGLASALGQVRDKKESGELPAGDPPAAAAGRGARGRARGRGRLRRRPRTPRRPRRLQTRLRRQRRGGCRRGQGR